MVKTEMVEKIAKATGVRREDVAKVLSSFIDSVFETVGSGERVLLSGFGTFFLQKLKKKPLFGEDQGKGFWTVLKFHPSREKRWKSTR